MGMQPQSILGRQYAICAAHLTLLRCTDSEAPQYAIHCTLTFCGNIALSLHPNGTSSTLLI
jgi:hypothetical protein